MDSMPILETNNSILLVRIREPIRKRGYAFSYTKNDPSSDPFAPSTPSLSPSSPSNPIIWRDNALLCFHLNDLISTTENNIVATENGVISKDGTNYEFYVPTTNISVSQKKPWDYSQTYFRQRLDALRFTQNKAATATLSIRGNFLASSISGGDTARYALDFPLISLMDQIRNFYANPYRYEFHIISQKTISGVEDDVTSDWSDCNLGMSWLPVKLTINFSGRDLSPATWEAEFVCPYLNFNWSNFDGDLSPYTQLGLRALNARDFIFEPNSNSAKDGFSQGHLVQMSSTVNITWKQTPTFYGLKKRNVPTNTWWAMETIEHTGDLTFIGSGWGIGDFTKIARTSRKVTRGCKLTAIPYTNITPNSGVLNLSQFWFGEPSLTFATDDAVIYNIKGNFMIAPDDVPEGMIGVKLV